MHNTGRQKKSSLSRAAQSTVEYFLILCVVVAAIVGVNFIAKTQFPLGNYFTKATTAMGNGAIPPEPVEDLCTQILARVDDLEDEIDILTAARDKIAAKIVDLEAEIPDLEAKADELGNMAAAWEASAAGYRALEAYHKAEAEKYQGWIDAKLKEYKDHCSECDPSCYDPDTCCYDSDPCSTLLDPIPGWEKSRDDERIAEAENRALAERDEDLAESMREAEAALREAITQANIQLLELKEQKATLDDTINDKQTEIDDYKKNHPECFK